MKTYHYPYNLEKIFQLEGDLMINFSVHGPEVLNGHRLCG
jgi:hypothetical protein